MNAKPLRAATRLAMPGLALALWAIAGCGGTDRSNWDATASFASGIWVMYAGADCPTCPKTWDASASPYSWRLDIASTGTFESSGALPGGSVDDRGVWRAVGVEYVLTFEHSGAHSWLRRGDELYLHGHGIAGLPDTLWFRRAP